MVWRPSLCQTLLSFALAQLHLLEVGTPTVPFSPFRNKSAVGRSVAAALILNILGDDLSDDALRAIMDQRSLPTTSNIPEGITEDMMEEVAGKYEAADLKDRAR